MRPHMRGRKFISLFKLNLVVDSRQGKGTTAPTPRALLDLFGVDGELGVELARRLAEERRDDLKRERRGLP